jgi:hypothetical protein
MDTDIIVVGAGLAGLVAAAEAADAGRRVVLVDQEGGRTSAAQAFWSFGGLFIVDSPEQRRMGIKDSPSWRVRTGSAARSSTARRTTGRARGPRPTSTSRPARSGLAARAWAMRVFPVVGWAERGDGRADGHGNSVPRFHITWGTGPGRRRALRAPGACSRRRPDASRFAFRHQVDDLIVEGGRRRRGARHPPRADERAARQAQQSDGRSATSSCAPRRSSSAPEASAATTTSSAKPGPSGSAPRQGRWCRACPPTSTGACSASPRRRGRTSSTPTGCGTTSRASATGTRSGTTTASGSSPARSSLWLDAAGNRLPAPYFPGFDTLGTLAAPARDRVRLLVVRADPEDHREGVRAVRARSRTPTSPART